MNSEASYESVEIAVEYSDLVFMSSWKHSTNFWTQH